MEEAIAGCGDDPMKKMTLLIPLVQSIQGEVMKKVSVFLGPIFGPTNNFKNHSAILLIA